MQGGIPIAVYKLNQLVLINISTKEEHPGVVVIDRDALLFEEPREVTFRECVIMRI